MREKLIELHKALCKSLHCNYDEFQCAMTIDTLITAENMVANGVTIPVRCKDCKHYMAEEKERCEALRATPYGLCLKHRCLPLAGYHEYRNHDDFCSYGERRSDGSDQ